MKTQSAQLNYAKITPRKMRLLADLIKGLTVNEAEAQLTVNSMRGSDILLKLLKSAIADAKSSKSLEANKLMIESVRVDQAPSLKRWLPRARGRATPILKRNSHITLVLKEAQKESEPRFKPKVVQVVKERDLAKTEKEEKKKAKAQQLPEKKEKVSAEPGFFRKVFRRKSI